MDLPHIYLINLPKDSARKDRVRHRLERLALRHTVVEGVGKSNNTSEFQWFIENLPEEHRHRLNELGCLFSHLKAMKLFYDSGRDNCIIMEDDAMIHKSFISMIRTILNLKIEYEVINLAPYNTKAITWDRVVEGSERLLFSGNGTNFGACCYIIKRDFIKEILENYYMPLYQYPIERHSSITSEYLLMYSKRYMVVGNPLCIEECLDSNIQLYPGSLKSKKCYWEHFGYDNYIQ